MAEYIDKAVALSMHEPPKSNRHYQTDNLDDAYGQGWDDALCSIEHIPAADVAPVVHGRWAIDEFGHYCTVCREYGKETEGDAEIVDLLKYGTPYCPNCGAKMDGGDGDAVD